MDQKTEDATGRQRWISLFRSESKRQPTPRNLSTPRDCQGELASDSVSSRFL